MAIYQRILVPLDGSETSRLGLQEAIRIAQATGGELCLSTSSTTCPSRWRWTPTAARASTG